MIAPVRGSKMLGQASEGDMKKLACMAMSAPVVVLSFLACGGSSETDGDARVANTQSADISRLADAEPCVVAAAAARAREAALAAVNKAPQGADQEKRTALADEAAARVFAEMDLDAIKCDPNVTLAGATQRDQALAADLALASWKGILCRAACWAAAGAGCGAISVACAGATVITIGGTSIPCAWAIIAGCGAAGGGASVCSDFCPD
jgi:hypothetical protein